MNSMIRIRASLIACAVAALYSSSMALAQTAKVDAQDVKQSQAGLLNSQQMDLGNTSNKGDSKVNVKGVNQSQAGLLNSQKLGVGNSSGGKTNVNASNINQSQAGLLNSQE